MTDDDTWGYIRYADEIREKGLFYEEHHFWYIGYVLFVLGTSSIIPGLEGIVVFQYLVAYLALIALYFTSINLFQKPQAALITCLWFLGFIMISFWNNVVYGESLFISLYCIGFFFLSQGYRGKLSLQQGIVSGVIILWAILTRPNGVAFLSGLIAIALYFVWKRIPSVGLKVILSFTLLGGMLILMNQMLSTYGIVEAYKNGEVVYNIQKMRHQPYASSLTLTVPQDLVLPGSDTWPLGKIAFLWLHNPVYSLKLFGTKLFYFLFYVRPYYSWIHNALALIALLPMYLAFIKEMKSPNLD